MVILSFLVANDFRGDWEGKSKIFDSQGGIRTSLPWWEKLITRSILLKWIQFKIYVFQQMNTSNIKEIPFDYQVFLKDYPEPWDDIWNLERTLLTHFQKTVEADGSKFVIVSLSDVLRINPDNLKLDTQLYETYNHLDFFNQYEFDFDKPERLLGQFAEEHSIPYLNLTSVFKEKTIETGLKSFYAEKNFSGHWNSTGHLWAGGSHI